MRLGRVFAAVLGGSAGLAFLALGIVAHRLDLWLEWQLWIALGALALAVAATALVFLRDRRPRSSLEADVEDVPQIDQRALAERIGGSGFAPAPQRRDGPIEGTNRPAPASPTTTPSR